MNDTPDHKALGLPADFTEADLAMLPEIEVTSLREMGVLEAEKTPAADANDPGTQAAGEDDANAKAEEKPKAEQKPETKPEPQFKQVPDTSAATADLTKVAADRKALITKFNDGEISETDFETQMDAIVDRQASAKATIDAAQSIQQQNTAQVQQLWYDQVDSYMSKNPVLSEPDVLQQFDAHLKAVNASQAYRGLPADKRIELAHGFLATERAALGKPIAGPAAAEAAPKPGDKAKDGPSKEPRPEPMTTLAGVPAAAANDAGDGAFSAIDNAHPDDAMKGFARMSPEMQAAFLQQF